MSWLRAGLAGLLLTASLAEGADFEARIASATRQPVEDAGVVLEPLSGTPPARRQKAVIAQQDRDFVPFLTVVQAGSAVDFPNRDPIKHHVYSFSPAKIFEIKLYAGKPAQPVTFAKPGEVAIGCNIHDWMEAYVWVVDSPYFAKTGADGRARIEDVPPGRYRLRVWHPRQRKVAATVEVDTASQHAAAVVLEVAPRMARPKPPTPTDQY